MGTGEIIMNPSRIVAEWRLIVSVILLVSATIGLRELSHGTPVIPRKSLDQFPHRVGDWEGLDLPIEEEVQEVLAATDLLSRVYRDPQQQNSLGLFVSFFASQRKGGAIHSPKNCLPGAGWGVIQGGTTTVEVAGHPEPLKVNRYLIQKDRDQQLVLYWYQSQGRVIASEYLAKACLVWDALRRNRTDGALVRIVFPVVRGDEGAAMERAKAFVRVIFPLLQAHIPS